MTDTEKRNLLGLDSSYILQDGMTLDMLLANPEQLLNIPAPQKVHTESERIGIAINSAESEKDKIMSGMTLEQKQDFLDSLVIAKSLQNESITQNN